MADPFIGEIKLVPYNFAPRGWAECNGQLLSIAQNDVLFALIGTMYGGDGQNTFALPDLRGRGVISSGHGPGLSTYNQGDFGGEEEIILQISQMPAHGHPIAVSNDLGNTAEPNDHHLAKAPLGIGYAYGVASPTTMPGQAVRLTGGNQPHQNRQPYLAMIYCIALEGVFPPRN